GLQSQSCDDAPAHYSGLPRRSADHRKEIPHSDHQASASVHSGRVGCVIEPRHGYVAGAETVQRVERNMDRAAKRSHARLPGSKSRSRAKGSRWKLPHATPSPTDKAVAFADQIPGAAAQARARPNIAARPSALTRRSNRAGATNIWLVSPNRPALI